MSNTIGLSLFPFSKSGIPLASQYRVTNDTIPGVDNQCLSSNFGAKVPTMNCVEQMIYNGLVCFPGCKQVSKTRFLCSHAKTRYRVCKSSITITKKRNCSLEIQTSTKTHFHTTLFLNSFTKNVALWSTPILGGKRSSL